jgi:hypothetical protein
VGGAGVDLFAAPVVTLALCVAELAGRDLSSGAIV